MAELILTRAEQDAQSWFELPDDVVGKLTKYSAVAMMEQCKVTASERDQTWQFAMMLVMASWCIQAGVTRFEQVIENINNGDGEHGNWKVSIEKMPTSH